MKCRPLLVAGLVPALSVELHAEERGKADAGGEFHRSGEVVDLLACAIFIVDYEGKPVGGQHGGATEGKQLDPAIRLFRKAAGVLELEKMPRRRNCAAEDSRGTHLPD